MLVTQSGEVGSAKRMTNISNLGCLEYVSEFISCLYVLTGL